MDNECKCVTVSKVHEFKKFIIGFAVHIFGSIYAKMTIVDPISLLDSPV